MQFTAAIELARLRFHPIGSSGEDEHDGRQFPVATPGEWGIARIYGYPGDSINGIMGASNRAAGDFEFIQVRHEEMAAFMACGHAKFTGQVGVCVATSGPGAIHLLNGLYDAKLDHQTVVAIVGSLPTDRRCRTSTPIPDVPRRCRTYRSSSRARTRNHCARRTGESSRHHPRVAEAALRLTRATQRSPALHVRPDPGWRTTLDRGRDLLICRPSS